MPEDLENFVRNAALMTLDDADLRISIAKSRYLGYSKELAKKYSNGLAEKKAAAKVRRETVRIVVLRSGKLFIHVVSIIRNFA